MQKNKHPQHYNLLNSPQNKFGRWQYDGLLFTVCSSTPAWPTGTKGNN